MSLNPLRGHEIGVLTMIYGLIYIYIIYFYFCTCSIMYKCMKCDSLLGYQVGLRTLLQHINLYIYISIKILKWIQFLAAPHQVWGMGENESFNLGAQQSYNGICLKFSKIPAGEQYSAMGIHTCRFYTCNSNLKVMNQPEMLLLST